VKGRPLYPMLVPIPMVCFAGALASDVTYWRTAAMQWANISAWLLVIGLIVTVFAVVAGMMDLLKDRHIRSLRAAWVHVVGNAIALVLSIVNALVHSRDAYTSVVPSGIVLSALVVIILLITAWNGSMVYRHGVGG
jgi:uncharacterized membrane protein